MKVEAMAVLVDGLFFEEAESIWGDILPLVRWPGEQEEAAQVLGRLLDRKREGFILHGGDDLLGRVVTAYWGRLRLGARPLQLWPLDVGEALVAQNHCGAIPAPRAARWFKRGGERFQRKSVATLKVTDSTEEAAWYGFSFGTGWVYRAYEARRRARGGGAGSFVSAWGKLASDTWRQEEARPVASRVAVDHGAHEVSGGSLVVTTLERSYFGIGDRSQEPRLWDHLPSSALVRRALTPEALTSSVGKGTAFESVHIDGSQGYVLDGRLRELGDPSVVQVMAGPSISLIYGSMGLGAVVGGLFPGAGR